MKTKTAFYLIVFLAMTAVAFAPFSPMKVVEGASDSTQAVSAGVTVDQSAGSCGVYMQYAPATGKIEIKTKAEHNFGPKFLAGMCSIKYTDKQGKPVTGNSGYMVTYVNLTKELYDRWMRGELAFVQGSGSKFSPCAATHESGGKYGRLACVTNKIGQYGLIATEEFPNENVVNKGVHGDDGKFILGGSATSISTGTCAAYIPQAPVDGYLGIESGVHNHSSLRFAKDVCMLWYKDAYGKPVTSVSNYIVYSIPLDSALREQYDKGHLTFVVEGSGGFQKCAATYTNAGKFGQLSCMAQNIGKFGLVDTGNPNKEDDED